MLQVGLDIGYGQTKVAWAKDFAPPQAEVHPSGAAPIEKCDRMGMGQAGDSALGYGEEVFVRGSSFGALIDPERISSGMQTLHEDFSSTPQYMALYLGALSRLHATEVDHLVTGLPVAQAKSRERAQQIKAMLEGVHHIRPGLSVCVKKVTIVPQAIGAYFSYLDRRPPGLSQMDTLLVIDFGHYSVDWVQVSSGSFRDEVSSSSIRGGSFVLDAMVKMIKAKHQVTVSREKVYALIRKGVPTIQLGREEVNLTALRAQASRAVAPEVIGEIRASLRGQLDEVNRVLVCGGGVPFYIDTVKEAFTRAIVDEVPNAVMANAIGFRLFAKGTADKA